MMLDRVGRNRENEAFGIGFMDALYGYALMLTRNSVEAEDLVQETYVRALKAQHRLREDSNIKGWFFTILRNIWLNQVRKNKSGSQSVDVDGEPSNRVISDSAVQRRFAVRPYWRLLAAAAMFLVAVSSVLFISQLQRESRAKSFVDAAV